ncbi:hypothetical protein C8J56DRAFT_888476 [Mycena floridula]|nr:hypothetical protein C8J56DRAFT_888476 [Mycena floridula]
MSSEGNLLNSRHLEDLLFQVAETAQPKTRNVQRKEGRKEAKAPCFENVPSPDVQIVVINHHGRLENVFDSRNGMAICLQESRKINLASFGGRRPLTTNNYSRKPNLVAQHLTMSFELVNSSPPEFAALTDEIQFRPARAGNFNAIRRLGTRCARDQTTFVRCLPIFLSHVANPVPSNSLSPLEIERLFGSHPVIPSFEALALGLSNPSSMENSNTIFPKLLEHWTLLHAWFCFGIENLLLPQSPLNNSNASEDHAILPTFALIIGWLSTGGGGDDVASKMPGLVNITLRLYLRAASVWGFSRHVRTVDALGELNLAIDKILGLRYDKSEFVDALQDTPNSIDIILSDLKALDPQYIQRRSSSCVPFTILGALASGKSDASFNHPGIHLLHDRFIANNSLSIVISLLDRLDYQCSGKDMNYTADFIYQVALYIHMSTRQSGPACIAQALDSHLLRAMARSFPLLSREYIMATNTLKLYDKILQLCQIFLLHPLVFRAVRRSFKGPYSHYPIPEDDIPTQVGSQWTKFHDAFRDLLERRRQYKKLSRPICENINCIGETPVSGARACGGCLIAHYCSRECQKQDWRELHTVHSLSNGSWLVKDFIHWFLLQQCPTMQVDRDLLEQARHDGPYPVVMQTVALADGYSTSVIAGKHFLERDSKWDSDNLVKSMVKEKTAGTLLYYFLIADIELSPFPVICVADA